MRTILTILFSILCASAWGSDPVVSVRGVSPSETVDAGDLAVLNVELDIRKSYHINSNQPLQDYLIPTSLELQPVAGFEIQAIRYPVPQVKTFPFSDDPMAVHEGIVNVVVEAVPTTVLKGKTFDLKGEVRYQACTDTMCLPEATQPFFLALSVSNETSVRTDLPVGSAGKEASTNPQVGDTPEPSSDAGNGLVDSGLLNFGENSLPVTLLLVFLGGLALNLTPCVYPMIPITITYFGGQAQGRKGNLVAHACFYITGMAITYSLLGVAAALTGGLLGAALQYPPVLGAISLVMVLLALSMFEVYELRMPGFINRLAGGNRGGFIGTILMGLTVGIVAAPCIGPFVLGLLTYVGNRGNAFLGFLLFFVLSLGMGIPLLVLGIFSGSINRLPRSGEWMIWVRKVFGFILLAMALFFVKTLFDHPLAYPLAMALLLVLAGAYLAWISEVSGVGKGFAWLRNIVGIGFFIAALIVAVSGIESYVQDLAGKGIRMESAGERFDGTAGIEWLQFSEQTLQQASLEGKPVLIDFYADWCAPCKEYDKYTFLDPEIIELSRNFIMVKVDLTVAYSPDGEALRKRYRVLGMPTMVFLMPDGSEIESLRKVGFEQADVFHPRMEEAYRRSAGDM